MERLETASAFGVTEVDRIVEDRKRPGPERQDERVIGDRVAAADNDTPALGVDRRHGGRDVRQSDVGRQVRQRVALAREQAERSGNEGRAQDEVRVRRDEADRGVVAHQGAQSEDEFDGGDATAGDDDSMRGLFAMPAPYGR